ncbi:MAG TPA: ATP-binding cassette domain-containing protein, partial [Candidatus Synoicihabitans sp.]|nr:ATP-binding cassette domain-containing protein [Candidatus Synoicihabitans sp.]
TGEMELEGRHYRPRDPLAAREAGIAMIYQELTIAPHLNVAENILLGVEPRRGPWVKEAELHRRSRAALAQVGLEHLDTRRNAGKLPIATRQLIEVARAVALGAQVIVLDEPTSSLARGDVERLFQLIRELRAQGRSIVYISHFLEEVQTVCDRFTVLRDGRSVATGLVAGMSPSAIVAHMVGRDVHDLYPRSPRTAREPLLELSALQGREKPIAATLTLHRGEVVGIAGLIGAGRTELLRAVFGLDPVVAGRIRVGTTEGAATPARRWSQGVGLLSEDRKVEGLALTSPWRRTSRSRNCRGSCARGNSRRPLGAGSNAWECAVASPIRRWGSFRVAISKRSRSPGCCTTTWTCSFWTNRRAESTSVRRRRSTA